MVVILQVARLAEELNEDERDQSSHDGEAKYGAASQAFPCREEHGEDQQDRHHRGQKSDRHGGIDCNPRSGSE